MTDAYYRRWEPLFHPRDLVQGPLLVVAPHPDDEVLGAGGLILAHRDAGVEVRCVVMTDGGRGDFSGSWGEEYPEVRKRECRAAAAVLGGTELSFLDLPDGGLAALVAMSPSEPVARLADVLRAHDFATVAFPSPYELHPDHKATALAAIRAILDVGIRPRVLEYEVGSFMPGNLLVDITDFTARKQAALACYASQLEHHDIPAKMNGLGIARTANVDDKAVTHAEAYLRVDADRLLEHLHAADRVLRLTDEMGPAVPYA